VLEPKSRPQSLAAMLRFAIDDKSPRLLEPCLQGGEALLELLVRNAQRAGDVAKLVIGPGADFEKEGRRIFPQRLGLGQPNEWNSRDLILARQVSLLALAHGQRQARITGQGKRRQQNQS